MTFLKSHNLVSKTYYGVTLCNENESFVAFSYIPLFFYIKILLYNLVHWIYILFIQPTPQNIK